MTGFCIQHYNIDNKRAQYDGAGSEYVCESFLCVSICHNIHTELCLHL